MMKSLSIASKTSADAKDPGEDEGPLHGNLREKSLPDLGRAAGGLYDIPRTVSYKKTVSSRASNSKLFGEGEHTRGISFAGDSSVSCKLPVLEEDFCGYSSPRKMAEKGPMSSTSRMQPQSVLNKKLSVHAGTSLSSYSLKRSELSLTQSIVRADSHTWVKAVRRTARNVFFYTGRLGLRVNPITLAFLDKDIERDWLTTRTRRGAKAFIWLGVFFFVQVCLGLADCIFSGIPLSKADGALIMLPTFLTISLPLLLLCLACTRFGRRHSTSFLAAAFFLYSPLFLSYSTTARLNRITEFFLGRPLAFDLIVFSARDSIIHSSEPLLLAAAAYAVGISFVWVLSFCFWLAAWWIVVHALMPPEEKSPNAWDWFLFFLSPIVFLIVTCFTARSGTIASRHRFSLIRQADIDLKGIRDQTALLAEHSALADLYSHIAAAESHLREIKLDYPKTMAHLERVISQVLIYLIQAQICVSHLDDKKAGENLNASTNAWAVSRLAGVEAPMEARGVLSHKETKESINSTKSYFQRNFYEPYSVSPNAEAQEEEKITTGKFLLRNEDMFLLGHRSRFEKMQSYATVEVQRQKDCSNFINDIRERLQLLPPASTEKEPATQGSSLQHGNRSSSEREKSFPRMSFKELVDNPHPEETPGPGRGVSFDEIMALLVQVGRVWNLNVFLLSELTNGNVLPSVGLELRRAFLNTKEAIPVDDDKWATFLREISIRYQKTSYHNERHAGTVAHLNVWLLRNTAFWDPLTPCQKLAVVVAALVHDVGHFGVNNSMLVNSSHPLSVTYNDRAVLENFHLSVAFRTMLFYSDGAANILEQLTVEEYKAERAAIIELVLETDMASHFDFLTRFKLKMHFIKATMGLLRNAKNTDDDLDRKVLREDALANCWMVAKACIRCADIGHSSVQWEFHYKWSCLLMKEFFAQGKQEAELGIPVSPVCDEANTDVPKSQVGFIKFICQPLFEALEQADFSGSIVTVCLRQMRSNSATWQRMADAGIDWKNEEEAEKESCQLVPLLSSPVS